MRLTPISQRIWRSGRWSGSPLSDLALWRGADVPVGQEQKQAVNPPIHEGFRLGEEHGQKSFCALSFALLLIHDRGTFSSFLSFLAFQCLLQHQYVLTYNCGAISFLVNEKATEARKAMPIILVGQCQLLGRSWTYMDVLQWKRKLGYLFWIFFSNYRLTLPFLYQSSSKGSQECCFLCTFWGDSKSLWSQELMWVKIQIFGGLLLLSRK